MRNVVITGAARGLGRVTAELFSSGGDRVFACDADESAVRNLASSAAVALAEKVDVADRAQLDEFFRLIWCQCDRIQVLVNNVGIAGPREAIENIEPSEWLGTLNANLNAAYWATRQVLGPMKRGGDGGCILNVSTASVRTLPLNRAQYVVSKAALEALTLCIAREAGPWRIRCNAVRPGMMDNERMHRVLARVAAQRETTPAAVEAEQLQFVSMRSKITMLEVARMLHFLASEEAAHVTAQIIAVDGDFHWES